MSNIEYSLADIIDVLKEVIEGGGEFRIYPKGTSMRPLIRQGTDSVVLRCDKESGAKRRDIAFYQRESGAYVLHRVMKIEDDGTFVMCGDNQFELERGIRREQIIGYVSAVYRGNKRIEKSSCSYRLYVFLWCCMPLRRLIRRTVSLLSKIKRFLIGEKKG